MNNCRRLERLVILFLLIGIFYFSKPLMSAEYFVSTPGEITTAMQTAQPGDTLTMTEGIWRDAFILFKGNGTEERPILLRAQIPGRVLLSGTSRLRITGSYLTVDGLYFRDGYSNSGAVIEFRENSGSLASHCRLTNTAIIGYNPPNTSSDYKWVSLYGQHNRVDHCYFRNKRHAGTTLVVWLAGQPNYHQIDHNYFAFRPELGTNGGETLRIGTSDWSMFDSFTLVEYNYFERCNGEVEIISNKSGGNIFRYNTFRESEGTLTLRHGNHAEVYGNFFLGSGNSNAGGVRIIGEDHLVYNNYFQDLYGSGVRSPLSIMNGVPDSPLNRYFQVKRARVFFNTFVNCRNPMVVGLGSDAERTLSPEDCVIANNVVLSSNSSALITYVDEPINITYEGNLMFGSPLGIPQPSGIDLSDPLLFEAPDSLWRPEVLSPVVGAAKGDFPQAVDDMDGQSRGDRKDIGADQLSGDPVVRRPLDPDDVGPTWFPPGQTISRVSPGQNTLLQAIHSAQPGDIIELESGIYANDSSMEITLPLTIRVADLSAGHAIIRQNGAATASRAIFEIKDGGRLWLYGLELDGMAGTGTPATFLLRTADKPMQRTYRVIADECYFHDVVDGGEGNFFHAYPGTFADSLVFTNCLFYNAGKEGIRLKDELEGSSLYNVDYFELTNCTFWRTRKEAVYLYGGDDHPFTPSPRIRINHCTFDNCGYDASRIIYGRDCDAARINNCIFSNSPANSESVIIEGLLSTLAYSDTFNVGSVVTNRDAAIGAGMVSLNPLYRDRDTGDFTLAKNSAVRGIADDGEALGDLRWAADITGIERSNGSRHFPQLLELRQNYPNPFNQTTTIHYTIPRSAPVRLNIYSLTGELVTTLLDHYQARGTYEIAWNAANAASGIYFYRLEVNGHSITRKMMLIK